MNVERRELRFGEEEFVFPIKTWLGLRQIETQFAILVECEEHAFTLGVRLDDDAAQRIVNRRGGGVDLLVVAGNPALHGAEDAIVHVNVFPATLKTKMPRRRQEFGEDA